MNTWAFLNYWGTRAWDASSKSMPMLRSEQLFYFTDNIINDSVPQDVNVYRYYRDLISFRQKGDPSMMLRAINPGEARYLDSAAGVHVKFRLAGVSVVM